MVLQIKQEKLENPAIEQQPVVAPTVGVGGSGSASLRFGKTVTGGTSAPESKVSKNNSNRKPKPKQPQPLYPIVSEYHHHHDHQQKKKKQNRLLRPFCLQSSDACVRVCFVNWWHYLRAFLRWYIILHIYKRSRLLLMDLFVPNSSTRHP